LLFDGVASNCGLQEPQKGTGSMSIAKIYEDRQTSFWWVKTAHGLMLSAKLCWDALDPLLWHNPKKFGPIHVVVAYWNSFFLLTAFAFENLYRAILVARGDNWRDVGKGKTSHALVKQLSSVTTLTDEEIRLLKRLETYLLWAGRYTVPWKLETYVDASQEFHESIQGSDLNTATGLYSRLLSLVQSKATAKGSAALEQFKVAEKG
jgi:hypothetical protein